MWNNNAISVLERYDYLGAITVYLAGDAYMNRHINLKMCQCDILQGDDSVRFMFYIKCSSTAIWTLLHEISGSVLCCDVLNDNAQPTLTAQATVHAQHCVASSAVMTHGRIKKIKKILIRLFLEIACHFTANLISFANELPWLPQRHSHSKGWKGENNGESREHNPVVCTATRAERREDLRS